MQNTSILSLIQNIAILLAIALLFDLSVKRWTPGKFDFIKIVSGLIIGGIGIILFLTPWSFIPGIIIDTRSILLPISGLFFGIIPTSIAMLVMIIYRFYLGGIGLFPGILLILSSGISGIIWRYARKRKLISISIKEIYLLGLTSQIFMLTWIFFFPREIATTVFRTITLPVLLFFPLVTCLIGMVMLNHLKRDKITSELMDEEKRLRTLLDVLQYQSNDLDQLFEYTLKQACKITNSQNIFLFQVNNDTHTLISKATDNQSDLETQLSELGKLAIHKIAIDSKQAIIINKDEIIPHELQEQFFEDRQMNYYMAVPYFDANSTKSVIVLTNQSYPYTETEKLHTSLFLDAIWKIYSRHSAEQALMSIEWMLSKNLADTEKVTNYDELTNLNSDGVILHTLGIDLLSDIANDYVGLLDTSAIIYEVNGEYALATFSSSWCKFLNHKSLTLCQCSVEEALKCDQWFCHQSCWQDAAKQCMTQNKPVDIECPGGLHIYSIPIHVSGKVMGAITIGYGNPPTDTQTLEQIAEKYETDIEELRQLAVSYQTRPPFIIQLAKKRLNTSANLIGLLIERDQSQQELKRKEELLDRIIDILPVGLWFADKEGNLTRANAAGARIWGAEPKVSIHEYGIFKARKYPSKEEVKTEDWALNHTITKGITIEDEILEIDTFDGKKKIILNYSTPILSELDEIEGAVVVNLDVTDRITAQEEARRAQEELELLLKDADQSRQVLLSVIEDQKFSEEKIQQLNQELEQRVKERTAQLEVANSELEAFAYSVSHDLRAPLRAMDGFSAALLEDYPDSLDDQAKHYLGRIQQASQRMGQLIEDLLHLSRVTRREINFENIDLSQIAIDISKEIQGQYKERDIIFEIEQPLPIKADAQLLRIAMENLMNNAAKFSSNKKHAKIQVGLLQNENETIYYVKDNGVGFNMKYSDKLFSPFQRLHSMEEFPGTGIGLVTVQRIINRHGGRIWPEAKLNKGATFYFTLGE